MGPTYVTVPIFSSGRRTQIAPVEPCPLERRAFADRINCNASNGSGFTQAEDICDAMKDAGITIYTVGFDLGGVAGAADVLEDCATSPAHFFNAENGTELPESFQEIARAIQQLRLTH